LVVTVIVFGFFISIDLSVLDYPPCHRSDPRTAEQTANIKIAAASISGVILKSGQVFSPNDQAGPFS
jgi:hypothetical protein